MHDNTHIQTVSKDLSRSREQEPSKREVVATVKISCVFEVWENLTNESYYLREGSELNM